MADHNSVTLIGRLTSDPQRKYTQGGKEVAEFSATAHLRCSKQLLCKYKKYYRSKLF